MELNEQTAIHQSSWDMRRRRERTAARDLTRDCLTDQNLDLFQSTILNFHNTARSKHEATPPLCWSQNIADDAQTHADNLADPEQNPDGIMRKSHYKYGENLYRAKILFSSASGPEMASSAVQSWYNQEPLYNYNFELGAYSGAAKRASAHLYSTKEFTQMIWKSSTRLGCAYSIRQSHYYFVVCMYTPEGSKGDKSTFHDNVRKKITCEPPLIYKGKHTTTGPFLLDQTVTVRCNTGYHLVGSRKGTCLQNETFHFDITPRCTGCEVQAIANGTASKKVGDIVPDGQNVKYYCDKDYSLDNAVRVLQCNGNDFNHEVPKCRKKGYCLRPEIEHGIAYAKSIDDDFAFRGKEQGWDHNIPDGHNISVICGEGYELIGNHTATCRGEKFTARVGTCQLCYIKDVKSIYNRYINVYSGVVHDRPPTCFGPNTEAVSKSTPASLPTYWFTLALLSISFYFGSLVT